MTRKLQNVPYRLHKLKKWVVDFEVYNCTSQNIEDRIKHESIAKRENVSRCIHMSWINLKGHVYKYTKIRSSTSEIVQDGDS